MLPHIYIVVTLMYTSSNSEKRCQTATRLQKKHKC